MAFFNADKSLTVVKIWFKDQEDPRPFHSAEKADRKGREYGIAKLKHMVFKTFKGATNINAAILYCKISGDELERWIINGKEISHINQY